jgi:hypothetical protein
MEDALDQHKNEVVATLITKYDLPTLSALVGNILRLYSKSNRLIGAFQNIALLRQLAMLITHPDFNI